MGAPVLLAEDERRTEGPQRRRPEAEAVSRRPEHGPPEEAARGRARGPAVPGPAAVDELLEPVRTPPMTRPDLAPEEGLRPVPRLLRERERERPVGGLRDSRDAEQAALPAGELGLVADEEVDQDVDPGREVGAERGAAHVLGLELVGDADVPVGRVRLVAVLGEPDPLRPEGPG